MAYGVPMWYGDFIMGYTVMVHVVMAFVGMALIVMAYRVMAYDYGCQVPSLLLPQPAPRTSDIIPCVLWKKEQNPISKT